MKFRCRSRPSLVPVAQELPPPLEQQLLFLHLLLETEVLLRQSAYQPGWMAVAEWNSYRPSLDWLPLLHLHSLHPATLLAGRDASKLGLTLTTKKLLHLDLLSPSIVQNQQLHQPKLEQPRYWLAEPPVVRPAH